MEGRSDSAAWVAHDQVQASWAAGDHGARIDGGESLDDLVGRFVPWLRSVVAGNDTVVAIGHGSLYRFVLPRVVVDRDGRAIAPPEIGQGCALVATPIERRLVAVGTIALPAD